MSDTIEVRVPDIGDFKDVPVIEVLVKPGDTVKANDSLITLESEKASIEVPSTTAGIVDSVSLKVGDKVREGTLIATFRTDSKAQPPAAAPAKTEAQGERVDAPGEKTSTPVEKLVPQAKDGRSVHASPAIRRFARELGVDLAAIAGSGPHGRVTRDDVQGFVKSAIARDGASAGAAGSSADASFGALPAWPKVDFAKYGEIERQPLSRIKKLAGPNLHRNWLGIPHITNYDEADITDLEAFRNEINLERAKDGGAKLTMLAFLVKACVAALQRFEDFNASLEDGELIVKHYYNIGFAADTPNGLVVPVLKNANTKGLLDIATELAALAGKARDGKLASSDMQGGTFTISSLGGIGGTAFTQIVNAPEVAILGAVRAAIRPMWNGAEFTPRLMLPISVSYDHRVIDGAGAARFLRYVADMLADFRLVSL